MVLAVIAGAIRALLASRGEELDLVTASVPVSARQAATGGQLGNQVGTMLVALPAGGDLAARVTRIAAMTRERKTAARGTSAALLGPPFRLLAPTGLLRWFFNRQRRVHTFVTDLRGPAEPFTFAGTRVRAAFPIPATTGNVTVTFGVLSYAGMLRITLVSDPSRMPDVAVLIAALRHELGSAARWPARLTAQVLVVREETPPRHSTNGWLAPGPAMVIHAVGSHAHGLVVAL